MIELRQYSDEYMAQMNMLRLKHLAVYLAITAGTLAALLGSIVLFGWYTHNPDLIQVNPAFVPMQYNTALGFVLGGGGLLALSFAYSRIAAVLGAMTLLIGIFTLIEYVFSVDLHIDQLFMQHYINLKTSNPGRMAPNTALCFSLTGVTTLIAVFCTKYARVLSWTSALGAVTAGLGFVAFTGYLIGVGTAYGWGALTKMAIHTAAGFIVLGIGLIAWSWKQKGIPSWLPLLVAHGAAVLRGSYTGNCG